MKDEIKRVIEELEARGHLTVNEHLDRDALAAMFYTKLFQDMTVQKFLNTFMPTFD